MTRWLTLVGITLQTSPPPLRPSGSRTQYSVRRALASLLSTLSTKKSSHPWLNDRTISLVDAKRTAEGTPLEKEATLVCSAGLAAAYHYYTARTAQKNALYQAFFQIVVEKGQGNHITRGPVEQYTGTQVV